MENLNAEQIKKALECCTSYCDKDNCPYKTHDIPIACMTMRMVDALALINSQEQRIKELTEENEKWQTLALKQEDTMQMIAQEKQATYDELQTVKADTVRKMQEALEQRIHSKLSYHGWYLKETVIPEIAKEMLESGDG